MKSSSMYRAQVKSCKDGGCHKQMRHDMAVYLLSASVALPSALLYLVESFVEHGTRLASGITALTDLSRG